MQFVLSLMKFITVSLEKKFKPPSIQTTPTIIIVEAYHEISANKTISHHQNVRIDIPKLMIKMFNQSYLVQHSFQNMVAEYELEGQ